MNNSRIAPLKSGHRHSDPDNSVVENVRNWAFASEFPAFCGFLNYSSHSPEFLKFRRGFDGLQVRVGFDKIHPITTLEGSCQIAKGSRCVSWILSRCRSIDAGDSIMNLSPRILFQTFLGIACGQVSFAQTGQQGAPSSARKTDRG